jgi:rhodanese-related sulfurtransferase
VFAVGYEGQATVYLPRRGCLRCLHPKPSASEAGRSCAEVGVLGPVPGLVGCLEAIEVIKLLVLQSHTHTLPPPHTQGQGQGQGQGQDQEATAGTGACGSAASAAAAVNPPAAPAPAPAPARLNPHSIATLHGRQLYMDSTSASFYDFELPVKNRECMICGINPSIRSMAEAAAVMDTPAEGCSVQGNSSDSSSDSSTLSEDYRISALNYYEDILCKEVAHVLVDVRVPVQFGMINLGSFLSGYKNVKYLSVPLDRLTKALPASQVDEDVRVAIEELKKNRVIAGAGAGTGAGTGECANSSKTSGSAEGGAAGAVPVYVICRRGVASVAATRHMVTHWAAASITTTSTTSTSTTSASTSSSTTTSGPTTTGTTASSTSGSITSTPLVTTIKNIDGGLTAWGNDVDTSFPKY